MRRFRFFPAAVCLAALVAGNMPATDVYLSLTAHGRRMELGLAGLAPATPTVDESKWARQIQEVLQRDLLFSRYFNLAEGGPLYTGRDDDIGEWESRGVNVLICGTVTLAGDEISLTGLLLDVGSRQVIWQKSYRGPVADYRRLAHELNDDIVFRFTGEKGIAHTRIAFVTRQGTGKELAVIDYDGHHFRPLTRDGSINLLPRWSPAGDEIIYTTYRYGNPDLYAIAADGGRRRPVSEFQGLNTAASFSPDGSKIALTVSRLHHPNIYLLDGKGKLIRRLTSGQSIDTSPSFAPNGQEIVFISDRPGYPQLYLMNLEGGNVRRLATQGYCDSPAWSPRGDKIVFAMRQGREGYDLYLYDLATSRVTRLTQNERNNENPSWSPDGRFIVFSSTRSGKSELYIIGADGSGVRKLADIPGASFSPSWSP